MPGIKGMGSPAQVGSPVEQDQTDIVLDEANNKAADRLPASTTPAQPADPHAAALDAIFGPQTSAQPAAGSVPAAAPAQAPAPQTHDEALDAIFGPSTDKGSEANPTEGTTLAQDIANAPARAKASFGRTQNEKLASLQQSFGEANVKPYGKDNFIIKGDDGKWKKFDSDNWDFLNMALNHTRDVVEGGINAGVTAAGTAAAAGEAATGFGAPAALPTIGAARALGGVAGTTAGDMLQGALGIPRDTSRSRLNEAATSAGANVLFSGLGDWLAGKVAQRAAAADASQIASKTAVAAQASQDVVDASNALKDAGLIKNVPGTDTAISAQQAALDNPTLKQTAKQISSSPHYQAFQAQQGQMVADAFGKIANAVSDFTGEEQPYVGEKFQGAVASAKDAAGSLIGDYRDAFKANAPDAVSAPKTNTALQSLADDLGYSRNANVYTGDTLEKPKLSDLYNQGYSKQGAKMVTNFIDPLMENIYNNGGKLSPSDLDGAYTKVQSLIKNLENGTDQFGNKLFKDSAAARNLIDVRSALADDYTSAIGSNLKGQAGQDYADQLAKYSQIKSASDNLTKVLQNDPVSSQAFSSYLFNKGPDSLSRIQATKTMLQDNPELWDQIKGNYLAKALNDNNGDYSKAIGQIRKLGPEALNEVFGDQTQNILNLGKYADAVASSPPSSATPEKLNFMKNLALGAMSLYHGVAGHPAANAAVDVLRGLDHDQKLAEFLSTQGVEKALGNVPPAQKAGAIQLFNDYLDSARAHSAWRMVENAGTAAIPQAAARNVSLPAQQQQGQ